MKKTIIIILTISFLFTSNISSKDLNGFYVRTEINVEINEYVESVFDNLLIAQEDLSNKENITLGQGIKVLIKDSDYEYYVFPVLKNGEIIDVINALESNGEYSATYTHSLAESLNHLKWKTSKKLPLTIKNIENRLYAEIGEERYLLEEHSFDEDEINAVSSNYMSYDSELETIDAFENVITNNLDKMAVPLAPVKKLPWTVYETQPNGKSWCASVTTTNIVRNTTSKYMTSAQMRSYLNDNNGLTINQVIFYLKNGLNSPNLYGKASGTLSLATVESEIANNRAIYASFKAGSEGHAIAIIGFNEYANAYYIHNPWYPYTETITIGGTYAAGGRKWEWTGGAIYNIK